MAITPEQAKALRPGDMLHHVEFKNSDGSPQRWRVSGQPKVWKTRPRDVEVPVKHGMYSNDRLYHYEFYKGDLAGEVKSTSLDLVNLGDGIDYGS